MAKQDEPAPPADDTPMENAEGAEGAEEQVIEDPVVELDKPTDVEGALIENPKLEEEPDEDSPEPEKPAEKTAEGQETPAEDTPSQDGDKVPEVPKLDDEPVAEPVAKDETGVYDQPKAADPGEFQPKADYSFEVTTTDGKTIKINSPQEAEAFAERLDSEEGIVSAGQFSKFTRGAAKMDVGLEREQADYLKDKQAFDAEQAQIKVRDEQINRWNSEINYLQAKGLLPEIEAAKNADWVANADDPAVKARMAVFQWMDKENAARKAAGIPEETSVVSAYHQMAAEQQADAERAVAAGEKQVRQRKGSMVGSNAPYEAEGAQPASRINGTGGTLRELELEAQMDL